MKKTERVGGAAPKFFRAGLFAKILMVLAVAVFAACDKDDDEGEALEFLEGYPTFECPVYAMIGDTISVTASGVTTEGVEYSWAFDGMDSITVVGADKSTIMLRVPDTLATFAITVTASAGDLYYTSMYTNNVTSVGPGSLKGAAVSENVFVDARDS